MIRIAHDLCRDVATVAEVATPRSTARSDRRGVGSATAPKRSSPSTRRSRTLTGFHARTSVIAGIGAERAVAGDFDGTMPTLTLVRDPQQTLGAREALARSLAMAGEYDRAMKVARHPYSDTGRMRAFIEIASVASSRGHADVAARASEEAIAAAEKRPADRGAGSFSFRDAGLLELARGHKPEAATSKPRNGRQLASSDG